MDIVETIENVLYDKLNTFDDRQSLLKIRDEIQSLRNRVSELDGMLGKRNINKEAEHLQQLAVKDLEVMQLRDVLGSTLWTLQGKGLPPKPSDVASMMPMIKSLCEKDIQQALSTTFTPDYLREWLGEPVAFRFKWDKNLEWHYSEYLSMRDYYDSAPLYAPKLNTKG